MALRLVKRLLARAAGRPRWRPADPGGEKGAGYYDALYAGSDGYKAPYHRSHYYFLWAVIADRARRDGVRRAFEVGCGPAQLAAFLLDQGVEGYTGFDLSPTAVEMARRAVPRGEFFVGSGLDPGAFARAAGADLLICTEVLEHIEDDLGVVSLFPPGLRCICTVPNFPYESHVRHFRDADEVRGRYGPFFRELDVATFRSPRGADDRFFLFDGVRNDHRAAGGL
ncbi:MAG: class I SAM-dependent methyltransferase [Gemmataceae bacterium]|nr:class I SAM-dependent methyltransferase [Gemmataceae bacterium]